MGRPTAEQGFSAADLGRFSFAYFTERCGSARHALLLLQARPPQCAFAAGLCMCVFVCVARVQIV